MKIYTLEAILNTKEKLNLNFLLGEEKELIQIDEYTNRYSEKEFIKMLSAYFDASTIDLISSFQIAIKGKNHSYSVAFENKFLKGVLEENKEGQKLKEYQIPVWCPALDDMRKFLIGDLEQEGKTFSKYYQYKNRLSMLVNKYINGCFDTEEELLEKGRIKEEILKEVRSYKTYRSLCIYRQSLERKKNQDQKKKTSVKNLNIRKNPYNTWKSSSIQVNDSYVSTNYQTVWENDSGEEREEFLEPGEIEEMMKIHGK